MAHERYQHCIDECNNCATLCNHCAVECLHENDEQLTRCIQLDMECAVICRSAAEIMTLGSMYSEKIGEVCADVCNACAAECEKHSHMEHCRQCAEACRRCADACMHMMEAA